MMNNYIGYFIQNTDLILIRYIIKQVSWVYLSINENTMFNKKSLAHVKELFLDHYNVISKHN